MERDPGNELEWHFARMPRFWPAHDRAKIRAYRKYRFAVLFCGAVRSGCLQRKQGGGGGPDENSRNRMGHVWSLCECVGPRRGAHGFECGSPRWDGTRAGISAAHTDETLR